jgi:hypothetical protein
VDIVFFQRFHKLLHVGVVDGEDLGGALSFWDLCRTLVSSWVGARNMVGEQTLRVNTITSCLPSARNASTIVLPTLPVPPMTATVTMLYDRVVAKSLVLVKYQTFKQCLSNIG